jgi:hypothetical protein
LDLFDALIIPFRNLSSILRHYGSYASHQFFSAIERHLSNDIQSGDSDELAEIISLLMDVASRFFNDLIELFSRMLQGLDYSGDCFPVVMTFRTGGRGINCMFFDSVLLHAGPSSSNISRSHV